MADTLVDYSLKSLARFLETAGVSLSGSFVAGNDFDWNKRPDPADPKSKKLPRQLPYAGIVIINDSTPPFTVGNILYEQVIDCAIHICGQSDSLVRNITGGVKQALKGAIHPLTSGVGIPLYDFALASGAFYANAGILSVDLGITEYFGADDITEEDKRKHRSVTLLTLSAYKDNRATLIDYSPRIDSSNPHIVYPSN